MSGSKKQGAGLQQDLEKTTTTVQRNGRLRGFEAKMRHFAFCIGTGETEVTAFGKSNHQHNDDQKIVVIIELMLLTGLTGLTSGLGWFKSALRQKRVLGTPEKKKSQE